MNKKVAVQVKIKGRVQGVYFRAKTREAAMKLHLTGHVKNLPDQTVQALFQGEKKNIDLMLVWCQEGSPRSSVDGVASCIVDVQPGLKGFDICY